MILHDQLPPADWYPDPITPDAQRYWDGHNWTRDTRLVPEAMSSTSRDVETTITSLPPSAWSRRQWTHVVVAVGIPVLLFGLLVASLLDTSGDDAQVSTTTTIAESASETPNTAAVADTPAAAVPTTRSAPPPTTSEGTVNPKRVEAGIHTVGSDIAPGVYRVSIHWARLDERMDVIDNDLTFGGVSIMTVLPTDSFIELSGTAVPLHDVPVLNPLENDFKQGTYLVGPDIAPGTYNIRAEPGATAYAARLNDGLAVIEAVQNDQLVVTQVMSTDFALRYTGTLERVE